MITPICDTGEVEYFRQNNLMPKFALWLLLLLGFGIVSCKKDSGSSGNSQGYQIKIVSGDKH
jgi:hypothetical protein